MKRARGLLLAGACFATLAGFAIAASAAAGQHDAAVGRATRTGSGSSLSQTGAGSGVASRSGLTASRRAIASAALAFARASPASGPQTLLATAVPQIPAQTVTGVSPSAGASGPGGEQQVTITGSGFTGVTDVAFGATDVTSTTYPCLASPAGCFEIESDTVIDADTPVEPSGTVDVVVTGGAAAPPQDDYSYFDPPTVTNVDSPQDQGATGIAVQGTNFSYPDVTPLASGVSEVDLNPTGAGSTIKITNTCSGSQPDCFDFVDDSDLTFSLPASVPAGNYDVQVITPGGTSAAVPADVLTVLPPAPTLTNLNPTSGPTAGGNSVTLTGTNFNGATDVNVGSSDLTPCPSAPCFTVDSNTQITVTMPANTPGNVNVNVTTPGGTTASVPYMYVAPTPTVTGVSPNDGALGGGYAVNLTGTGFEAAGTPITSQVAVGTTGITTTPCAASPTAPCFTVNSATSITIGSLPAGTAGQVNITVTTPGGTSATTSSNVFTYNSSAASVSELAPEDGATSGGEAVSLSGNGFEQEGQDFVTDVFFGSTDVSSSNSYPCQGSSAGCFIVLGQKQLAIYTPAHAAGTVDVQVETPLGKSPPATGDQYTFIAPGAYTAINPIRICDTRPVGHGISSNQCNAPGKGTLGPGHESVGVQMIGGQIPAGAQAVVVNITAIDHGPGITYVVAYPAGGSPPSASNINLLNGKVGSNLAIVQLGTQSGFVGQMDLFNALGSADVIVDVEGYFAAPTGASAGAFHTIPPLRICDSRGNMGTECDLGTTNNPLIGGTWTHVVLSGVPPGVSSSTPQIPKDGTAAAAAFNLTATAGTAPTFLAVAPPTTPGDACPAGQPAFSNVNPAAGTSLPNRVISNLGPNQDICLYSAVGSINYVIDVNGWFGKAGATTVGAAFFYSVPPTRICDTRTVEVTGCYGKTLQNKAHITVNVAGILAVPTWDIHSPAPLAVVANLTGIAGTAATVFTLYPADETSPPRASDLNPSAGEVIANLTITSLAQTGGPGIIGNVNLYNGVGSINAILDVAGWFQ